MNAAWTLMMACTEEFEVVAMDGHDSRDTGSEVVEAPSECSVEVVAELYGDRVQAELLVAQLNDEIRAQEDCLGLSDPD